MTLKKTIPVIGATILILSVLFGLNHVFADDSNMSVYTKLQSPPEGMCMDSKKNIFATIIATGEVIKLESDGKYSHVAWVPSKEESGTGQAVGIETDNDDNILVAYTETSKKYYNLFDTHDPACKDVSVTKSGVYKIDAKTHKVTKVLTKADGWPVCFPDDIDVDRAGNIYVSDLTYAGIWKIDTKGEVKLWSADPLLNYSDPSLPLGVNVIVLDKAQENIYAATTTIEGLIVKIPINKDGSAGKAVIHSRGHTYFDGIEIDDEGYIYASEPAINQIIVISPEAGWLGTTQRKVIARKGPLQGPTSLVLRDGVLYTANLAFGLPEEKKNNTIVAIKNFTKD